MNAYEELAGYRFAPGRDYDKRSVETFRARVLNLVDELLNQLTQLNDEVVDLRDRSRPVPSDPAAGAVAAPVVPTTWLEALTAGDDDESRADRAEGRPGVPAAFPAPPVASWLADLEQADHPSFDDAHDGDSAGSTAELLLAAAGNAVAVQAAAAAVQAAANGSTPTRGGGEGEPPFRPSVPPASTVPSVGRGPFRRPGAAVPPPPAPRPATAPPPPPAARPSAPPPPPPAAPAAAPVAAAAQAPTPPPVPTPPPSPAGATNGQAPPVGPAAAAGPASAPPVEPAQGDPAGARLDVSPGDKVVVRADAAVRPLPIVLDDGLPDDAVLPTPVRHWGGWMR